MLSLGDLDIRTGTDHMVQLRTLLRRVCWLRGPQLLGVLLRGLSYILDVLRPLLVGRGLRLLPVILLAWRA